MIDTHSVHREPGGKRRNVRIQLAEWRCGGLQEVLKIEDLAIIMYQNYKRTCLLRGQFIAWWLIAVDLDLNPSPASIYTLTV